MNDICFNELGLLLEKLANPPIDHIESTHAITIREIRSYLDGYEDACNMVIEELQRIMGCFSDVNYDKEILK